MNRYAKITPEGTRDLLFEECSARKMAEGTLSHLFKKMGYNRVITPTIEFFDVFNRESTGVPVENLYKLTDNHGRLLVLRSDNTMPIARLVATRLKEATMPVRLYYSQNVFKSNKGLSGNSDEVYQSGIELIGTSGLRADLEVITSAVEALNRCGAPDFCVEISHAGIFSAIVDELNLSDEVRDDLIKLVASKNYAALNDLLDKIGENSQTAAIRRLPRLFGSIEVLDEAEKLINAKNAAAPLAYLRKIYNCLAQLNLDGKIRIDLGQVHSGNYYTGIVLRGYIEGSGITVLSGGRYDNLLGEFGYKTPAMGFGVDVDAVAKATLQRGEIITDKTDVLVFGADGFELKAVMHTCELSETTGLFVENCTLDTLEQAKDYAKKCGVNRIDLVDKNGITTINM